MNTIGLNAHNASEDPEPIAGFAREEDDEPQVIFYDMNSPRKLITAGDHTQPDRCYEGWFRWKDGQLVCENCDKTLSMHYRPTEAEQQAVQAIRDYEIAQEAEARAAKRREVINPKRKQHIVDTLIVGAIFALLIGAWLALAYWQHGGQVFK